MGDVLERAEAVLKQAAAVRLQQAIQLFAARDFQAAGRLLEELCQSGQPTPLLCTFLAVCRNAVGDEAGAREMLGKATEAGPLDTAGLPPTVQEAIRTFFLNARDWLPGGRWGQGPTSHSEEKHLGWEAENPSNADHPAKDPLVSAPDGEQ
jgi:hypothetical protein